MQTFETIIENKFVVFSDVHAADVHTLDWNKKTLKTNRKINEMNYALQMNYTLIYFVNVKLKIINDFVYNRIGYIFTFYNLVTARLKIVN